MFSKGIMIVKRPIRVTSSSRALTEDVLRLKAMKTVVEAPISIMRRARTLSMMSTSGSRAWLMSECSQTPGPQSLHQF